jgi:hypothetical protein
MREMLSGTLRHMRTLFISFACLAVLSACQSLSVTTPPTPAALSAQSKASGLAAWYPINSERTWVFALEQWREGHPTPKHKRMRMRTESAGRAADGAEMALLRRDDPDAPQGAASPPTLVRRYLDRVELSRATGALALSAESETPQAMVSLRWPFTPGTVWGGRPLSSGQETIQIIGVETVTVPAGTFQAVQVEHRKVYTHGKQDILRYWYAEGVGLVKLYEELTYYFGEWQKFYASGELSEFSHGR